MDNNGGVVPKRFGSRRVKEIEACYKIRQGLWCLPTQQLLQFHYQNIFCPNAFLNLVQQRMQALTKRATSPFRANVSQRQLVYNTNPAARFKCLLQVHLLLPDLALDNTQMCITVMTRVGRQALQTIIHCLYLHAHADKPQEGTLPCHWATSLLHQNCLLDETRAAVATGNANAPSLHTAEQLHLSCMWSLTRLLLHLLDGDVCDDRSVVSALGHDDLQHSVLHLGLQMEA
jgi:hypothetical protein